jgi:hypothetical protein
MKLEYFDRFSKQKRLITISNFMEIRPMGTDLFHADGHDKANSRFSQFCYYVEKSALCYQTYTKQKLCGQKAQCFGFKPGGTLRTHCALNGLISCCTFVLAFHFKRTDIYGKKTSVPDVHFVIQKDLHHSRSRNLSSWEYRSQSATDTSRSTALLKILFVISLQTRKRVQRTEVHAGKRASLVRKNTDQSGVPSKVIRSPSFVRRVSLLQALATWRAEEAAAGTTCAHAMVFSVSREAFGQFPFSTPEMFVICLTHRADIPSCFLLDLSSAVVTILRVLRTMPFGYHSLPSPDA